MRNPAGRLIALAPVDAVRLGRVAPAVRLWVHDFAALGTPLIDAGEMSAGGRRDRRPAAGRRVADRARPAARWAGCCGAGQGGRSGGPSRRDRRGAPPRRASPGPRRLPISARRFRRAGAASSPARCAVSRRQARLRSRRPPSPTASAPASRSSSRLRCAAGRAAAAPRSHPPSRPRAFARDVVFNRSERGTVRIASIRVGERPVAVAVSFVAGRHRLCLAHRL